MTIQARIIGVGGERLVQPREGVVQRPLHVHRVDAQGIGVAEAVRQRAHRLEGRHLDRRNHAECYVFRSCPRPHGGHVGRKISCIQVAVGVNPEGHGSIMPEPGVG